MAKKKKKWIQGAIKNKGALTRAAKARGMSISKFCSLPNLSAKNKRRCALAKTLSKLRKRKKR